MVFLLQISQLDDLGLGIGLVHVMDMEFLEVGNHDPAGGHVVGQQPCIATGLLEGRKEAPVALLIALFEVDIQALLLDQDAGRVNIAVDKDGGSSLVVLLSIPLSDVWRRFAPRLCRTH